MNWAAYEVWGDKFTRREWRKEKAE